MSKEPIISVSGVRGKVAESLDPQVITRFSLAFGTFVEGKTVVIGRDSRTSSPLLRHAVLTGLLATGCHVIDVGLCSTPTILLMSKILDAQGSITITASHNPVEWNGIEFASESGRLLNQAERDRLLHIYQTESFNLSAWDELGTYEEKNDGMFIHLKWILELDWINVDSIRRRKFKVALDCGNGAGSVISPLLLHELGCDVVELNCVPDGNFNRPAEPTPEAISELCMSVRESEADIGFAHDGDADRVVIVTNEGIPLSGEWTYAFVSDFILSKTTGDIVATVSTSRMLDDIAEKHGVAIHRTKVGVGWVVEKMLEVDAVLGGEGTGGVIYPSINYTTDGITSIAAILQYLADSQQSISELVDNIPKYEMCRKKFEIPSQEVATQLVNMAMKQYQDETKSSQSLDLTDGIKLVWDDRWVNIRKSGTEPVIRVFSEAPTNEEAETLCDEILECLDMLLKQINL
ncbi:phosphoglucosamine mutase [Candidatus Poribacteria bacterium]|nr:MAG: phosphoglucosamine mutase [Candidatus Poribacteria bacterium]